MCILCTCTSTQGVNLLSAVYWCLIQKMIVFPVLVFFFFFFLVNYVKVLELYWLLTILKQYKTKLFELYYRGWHCSGTGQSFLQSFSYHLMILVQELEIFLFIPWYFISALHSMSMKPSGTKWQNKIKLYMALDYLKYLGSFQMMISLSFIVAWNKVLCYMWANQVVFGPDI